MEKNSSKPVLEEVSSVHQPPPKTPPAECQKVAFKLGGSEEADLDHTDMETKDLDIGNGENQGHELCNIYSAFWQGELYYS